MNLSVVIITKNEAHNIGDCLASVAFANQWIIVDSGSTDGTVEVAQAAGATVIDAPDWPGFGPQKNRALDAATGDWVLSLDADERISPQLQKEILAAVASGTHASYEMPRLSSFCGTFIRHGGWYPDRILRLFRRGAARFSTDLVHERVIAPGPHGRLQAPIIHYSYLDDEDCVRKLAQYSTLGAQQAYAAGRRSGLRGALLHAVAAFLRSYIFKRGFLDGRAGVMVALYAFETTYHKYFKLMLLSSPVATSSEHAAGSLLPPQ